MIGLSLLAAAAALTPQGFRAGPPNAPKRLVEYASLNCPHCARFSAFASDEIAARVGSGKLAFEFRPFLIFPHDVPATLIARCVPAAKRLGFIEDYYRNSAAVTARLSKASQDELKAANARGVPALNRALVALGGMKPIAARFGLTGAAVDRCVADPSDLVWLQKVQNAARTAGVTSTPTFEVNGRRVRLDSVEELRAALDR